ncbi:M48 family metallopeptidase [Alkalilimnicola ehrlichii MLHE-1]|uniref:Peptidase M48, Ste24p n=1 Tax=Alkalilimnicola ehrlichii (strain ATCC BAA-1101 / DSM 17681 / MLHE-1) TaxID=187272 RepID=Q0AAG3_ALKEH|nr:M48 family metallopeptidase [Alkalilimnicola ehrlichii]ABI56174.1 peptidase M48, Ste24p [Alkalilimnicola ehrlichii MLHE-1]
MDFFEHQDRARRTTLWLILFFVLGVIAIAVVVNALALFFLGEPPPAGAPPEHWLSQNLELLITTTVLVVAGIGLASAFRVASLSGGGSKVAEMLGGTRVTPDTRDPKRRQLLNVVEEVALASGTPVPDVYVLEEEAAINAFAAGYSQSDAAVAVTRGTLEKLNREELQGVVAHEFAHIVNGDMRLNIRLMGVVFGLLVLTVVGRFMTRAIFVGGGSREGKQAAMGIAALGLALILVGALGVFFGRLIKAAVSRQREFLADASAVQYTRNPDSIGGALKKIAVHSRGSGLESPETEEVSHMLFASGFASMSGLLATHPPLEDRIRAIEPQFDPERDLPALAEREQRRRAREEAEAERRREAERAAAEGQGQGVRIPGAIPLPGTDALPQGAILGAILADVDQPDTRRHQAAAQLLHALPEPLRDAVHGEDAGLAVLYTVISEDPEVRRQQLARIREDWGEDAEARVREWLEDDQSLAPGQRLPLVELALPALRHQPRERLGELRETLGALIRADGGVSVFEFALARMFDAHLRDILNPGAADRGHARVNAEKAAAIQQLLSVLAWAGAEGDEDAARQAYAAGMALLYRENRPPAYGVPADWPNTLTEGLERLDRLGAGPKRRLLEAMVATVGHNGQVNVAEAELLRALAAALHVPIPLILPTTEESGGDGVSP